MLDAEEGLRLGGVGGVELLDVGGPGKSGWDLLEKLLAPHSTKSSYHPMVTRSEHGARIRMKVNTTGPKKALMYNMKKERLGGIRDVDTAGAHVVPVVAFTKAWWMGGQHGVTMELRHCVVTDPPKADFDWPMGTEDENPF